MQQRAVHKGRLHKIAKKLTPSLLSAKCPYSLNLLPSCPSGHTMNFKKSDVFCTKKCGRPHLKNPLPLPLTVDVFYGRPLRKELT